MRRLLCWAVALFATPAVTVTAQMAEDAAETAGAIAPELVEHHIGVLAHDSMRGRDTPSPELESTAQYIAKVFQDVGLEPAGDSGTYFQRYLIGETLIGPDSSRVLLPGGREWVFGSEFNRYSGSISGSFAGSLSVLVGQPDFRELGEADLSGKIVVWFTSLAEDGWLAQGMRRRISFLRRRSPEAVLMVVSPPDSAWAAETEAEVTRRRLTVDFARPRTPVLEVRAEPAVALLQRMGLPGDLSDLNDTLPAVWHEFPDQVVRLELRDRPQGGTLAPNVVGVLPGSDPALRDEYLLISAHMDHVGVGRPNAHGDSIYNGADDNASGTAGVLALAEALSATEPRPRRSVVFLTVSGEEKGLWGSAYFSSHPTVPMDDIVANLNMDMIGRNWEDTVVAIGRHHSELGELLDRVNQAHPELNLTVIDDPWPRQSFYTRSDHYNFARRGVPILFFFNGTHEDYHRPSDEIPLINVDKTVKILRLLYHLSLEIADAETRPRWDPESYSRIVP